MTYPLEMWPVFQNSDLRREHFFIFFLANCALWLSQSKSVKMTSFSISTDFFSYKSLKKGVGQSLKKNLLNDEDM